MADLRGLFMRIGRDRRVRNLAALLFLAWVVVPLTMGSRHLAQCECDFVRTWKVSNLAWSPMNGGVPPDAAPTLSTSVDNGRVLHQLRIGQTPGGLPYGSPATATWTPPEGSTSIDFDGNPPANPEGPPPYRFTVVVGGSVQVSYIKPVGDVTDTFTATTPAGTYGTTCVTKGASFTAEGSSSADLGDTGAADPALHVAEAPASAAEPSGPAEAPAAVYYVWNSNLWVGDPGNALSTATCQEWVDLLQSDDTFFGVQFPVPGSTATSGVATIPISLRGADAPRLELLDYTRPSGQQTVLSLPLELAPERAGYLVRSLPAQPGRFWAALRGAASPRVLCPSGMNLAADQWEFKSTINFDYGGQAGACAGCVVELHGCYEGDGSTLPGAGGASVLRGLGLHQSEGITCIGPAPIRMFGGTLAPPYLLTGPGFGSARPGHQVSFRHEFEQVSGTPTATLSVTSSLGVPWVLYEDFNGAPDLSRPIVAPITVSDGRGVWVSAVIPAGLAGAEVVRVTATSGSAQTWNTDHLWIGPFTPPPAPTSTATPAPTSYSRWLPVASHANGANDSRWRTDLGALNPGTEAATAELRLYTPGNVKTTSV
ncbi:MAG: hypothetical protein HY825_12300, partial [Acidobacteria bacterium]|nr:hypothetical protein [Acidobacteriota bacterium]